MKKAYLYIVVLIAGSFVTTSCENQLVEEFPSAFAGPTFPTAATAEILLNEAYGDWMFAYNNHRMGWGIEFPTPAMQYRHRQAGQPPERHNLNTWTWLNTSREPAYYELMTTIWQGVRTANDAIGLIGGLGDEVERRDAMVAEAKVLRALAYFNMVRMWGGVPIIDKAQTLDDDLFVSRASIAETYAFIAQDLQEAIEDLPTRSEFSAQGIPPGHITKGGAQGLLAKVYLTMAGHPLQDDSNLQEARDLLEEVINSGEWALVQSATPYADLWAWDNEFNSERMIDVQKEAQGNQGQNFRGIWGYMTPPMETEDIWATGVDPAARGAGLDGIPPEYVEWYRAHDSGPRFEYTIVTEFVVHSDYRSYATGDTMRYNLGPDGQAYVGKYRAIGAPELNDRFRCPNNFPVLRYADILLMHSEVTNELDAPDYTGMNATRARAGLPALSGLSKDAFRDSVFVERELELAYEHNLLFDMRRRGFEYCQSRLNGFYRQHQNESAPGAEDGYQVDYSITNLTEPHRMLFPYPVFELAANPNLEQNPGY